MCRGLAHQAFQEERVVPERAQRGAPGAGQGRRQLVGGVHHHHALAAAAGGGLDQHREADLGRRVDQLLVAELRFGDARGDRDVVGGDVVLGADLVAHEQQRVDARPDEHDARVLQRARELDVLGEETVAGVHGLGAAAPAGLDDRLDVQVAFGGGGRPHPDGNVGLAHVQGPGVGIRIDGHGPDAHALERPDHAHGDLPAVGNQHGVKE